MIYMFLSNNPSSGDINLSNLSCLKLKLHVTVCVFKVPPTAKVMEKGPQPQTGEALQGKHITHFHFTAL